MSPLRRVVDIIGRVLIGAGILLLLFSAYQIWGTSYQESRTQSDLRSQLQQESKSRQLNHALAEATALDKLPTGPPVTAPRTAAPPEGEPIGDIRIPVIGVNQVVVEGTNTADLRKGPGHYTGTPLPGQGGNAGVAGHRTTYGHPFYNLDSVKVGDPIVVTTLQGVFVYDATRSFVVSPTDTDVIKNVFANILTLTTCNPRFSASTRLIVQGTLVHSQLFPNSGLKTAALHADPKSENLAGNSNVQLADALLWGLFAVALGVVVFYAAWRFRAKRWFIYGGGAIAGLVVLWFFFGAVSPLLPASFFSAVLVEQPLSDHFRGFAALAERDGGTTYPAICRGVADDEDVLSILDRASLPQRRPLILLAAVHFLLLSGVEHPLAAYYDTVTAVRGEVGQTPSDPDPTPSFVDFCRVHRGAVEDLVATRTTQTNEVGRCTGLLPGLCHVASRYGSGVPLSLLDLGTSAGLNLLFDDYGYTFRSAADGTTLAAGTPGSAVRLECEARDDLALLPDLALPSIAERVGLDVSPIDPRSDEDALWLQACQWPDNPLRFGRLRAALGNVRASSRPPRLEQGDMIADLPQVAATIPGDNPLVVFHSWVAAYLDEPQQRALAAAVQALGAARPVHHLYCETPFETPGLPTPPSPVRREGPDLATTLVHVGPGGVPAERLADTHPHGYWIRWWPTA